jgi:hypothetical protein
MHGCQLYGVSSDTLVRLASGLSEHCVKKKCGLAGVVFREDPRLSTFASPESVRELQRWDKTNYQLARAMVKLDRKREKKKKKSN